MALSNNEKPKYAVSPNVNSAIFDDADLATTEGSITNSILGFTAETSANNSDFSIVESIIISSNDAAAKEVIIQHDIDGDGTKIVPLLRISIPAGSGTVAGTPPVDALDSITGLPVNAQSKKYLKLNPGAKLYYGIAAALTSGDNIWVVTTGGDAV